MGLVVQVPAPSRLAMWWMMTKRAFAMFPSLVRALIRGSTPSIWATVTLVPSKRYSDAALDTLRQRGDPRVDAVIRDVADDAARGAADPRAARETAVRALMGTLASGPYVVPGTLPAPIEDWLQKGMTLPTDVDQQRMESASEFFVSNAFLISLIYGTSSLLEAYACPRGMRVLAFTQKLRQDPYRRLSETLQWALMIEDPEGLKAQGHALAAIAKVRLMHGSIRYLASQQPDWDQRSLGVPINVEDLLGTLMSFSAIVIRDLPKLGVEVAEHHAEDRVYFWNVVGRMLGIDADLLPRSLEDAREIVETIKRRQQDPSVQQAVPQGYEEGKRFAAALVEFHRSLMPGERFDNIALRVMRRVAGDELCDLLDIPRLDGTPVPPPDRYDDNTIAVDWGDALITRQQIEVPGDTVRGGLWSPPRYRRERPYEIPEAMKTRWDRERSDWREAPSRLANR